MLVGIDTNVLLRALLGDNPEQSAVARRFLSDLSEDRKAYVSIPVALELFWVLRSRYRLPRRELLQTLSELIQVDFLLFQNFDVLARALKLCENGRIDFSDAVVAELHREMGCVETITFDEAAARQIPAMTLLA